MLRKRRFAAYSLVLIGTVLGVACTTTQKADATGGARPATGEPCFSVRTVDSVSPLHARFVYVRVLGGEQYLLTLDSVYLNLPAALGFKITSDVTWVCSDSGARLSFRDADVPVSARIIRVESVPSREAAERLVKERSAPTH